MNIVPWQSQPAAIKLDTLYELKPRYTHWHNVLNPLAHTHLVRELGQEACFYKPVLKRNDKSTNVTIHLVVSLEGIANGVTKLAEIPNIQSVHFEKFIQDKLFKVILVNAELEVKWISRQSI